MLVSRSYTGYTLCMVRCKNVKCEQNIGHNSLYSPRLWNSFLAFRMRSPKWAVFWWNVQVIFHVAWKVCQNLCRLQTTHKTAVNTFHGCLTRKKYTRATHLRTFRCSYYFLMQFIVSDVISPTFSQENPLVFRKVTASTAKPR